MRHLQTAQIQIRRRMMRRLIMNFAVCLQYALFESDLKNATQRP